MYQEEVGEHENGANQHPYVLCKIDMLKLNVAKINDTWIEVVCDHMWI